MDRRRFGGVGQEHEVRLMLVAIEENSGSVLSTVEWSYKLISERDPLKDVHFQTKLDELSIESFNSESEYIRFYHKYLLEITFF